MKNERFGRLLKGMIKEIADDEGKTAPAVEDELGNQIGLSGASIQRYKAGYLPPETRTIEILAEAGVKRGYHSREWLHYFLQAASYPSPEKLLDRLCPIVPIRPRPPHVYENLPAPTYSQFIMRREPFEEVLDGLRQRSAAVVIASLGGMGKTSLAREVAARCLKDDGDAPVFDAVVWVSDRDRPGTTTLSIVLDEIARTLDYPGFTQFEHEEKQREVEQLLRRQRVLLVIDNFETITDGALLAWLLRLPEPSKAIITTREYRREFRRGAWPIELRGMNEAEAQEFINQRVRLLRVEKMVVDSVQFAPLIAATGGNPKALEMALGYLKYQHQPLQQVVDDLYTARGDIFEDLFSRAWSLLDEAARRVLLSMPLFPSSASGEALAATADVQGFAFDRAIERLTDLALLDSQQTDLNAMPRYVLHPLVRAFASAKLSEIPEFDKDARVRWVRWYIQLVTEVADARSDLSKLELIDPEQEAVHSVIMWTSQNQLYADTIKMVDGCEYYYYVRGLAWTKRPYIHLVAAQAARNLGDLIAKARHLAFHIQWMARQDNVEEVEPHLSHLSELMDSVQLPADVTYQCRIAIALYKLNICGDLDGAQQDFKVEALHHPGANYWLAFCLYKKSALAEAQQLYEEYLQDARCRNRQRNVIGAQIHLAAIALLQGNLAQAEEALKESDTLAHRYNIRHYFPSILRQYARLHIMQNNISDARDCLTEAIDLLERLGMRHDLGAARQELASLQTIVLPESDTVVK